MDEELSVSEKRNASNYLKAEPVQFGDMHERMKWLMSKLDEYGSESMPNEVWHAIFDLQTEVKYYEPVSPPYGRRAVGALSLK